MSSCNNVDYETANKLRFVRQCDMSVPNNVLDELYTENAGQCCEFCSVYRGGLCQGAAFGGGYCLLFPQGGGKSRRPGIDPELQVYYTPAPQVYLNTFKPRRECPYENGSEVETENGQKFKIRCGQDYQGDDLLFNVGTDEGSKSAEMLHSSTLDECLEECSTGLPLCLGVAWNPDVSNGWANCYPKWNSNEEKLGNGSAPYHSALRIFAPNTTCADGTDYGSKIDGKKYRVTCSQRILEPDLATTHATSLEDCIDQCAEFPNESPCSAVSYQGSGRLGYLNCHLKKNAGRVERSTEDDVAVLATDGDATKTTMIGGPSASPSSSSSPPPPSPNSSNTRRTGVIAGSVVGGLALIALLTAALWWRRRRKRSSLAEVEGKGEKIPSEAMGHGDNAEKWPSELQVHPTELEARPRPELETVERAQELRQEGGR